MGTPNSTVSRSDSKKKYTPHTLSNKVAAQLGGKVKKNLEATLNDSRDADDDSDKDDSNPDTVQIKKKLQLIKKNNKRNVNMAKSSNEGDQNDLIESQESSESVKANQQRGRRGKMKIPTPEKTVIDETESEDDQPQPQINRRGGLRGSQSSSSVTSTL